MKKLLVICGPTATGKTNLAIYLATKFGGEIVSADSRQVFKLLDIGTGKDLPENAVFRYKNSKIGGYYEVEGVRIWGYDLVDPNEEFSVSQYARLVTEIIKDIYSRGKMPILVGGTGLYIRSVVDGIETSDIPKNINLRESFENYDARDLFTKLSEIDPIRAASLNFSDKSNPRRLIRAIEIADYRIKTGSNQKKLKNNFDSVIFIGLTDTLQNLSDSIEKRIKFRIEKGILGEIQKLRKKGISWKEQSMSALGYLHWKRYLDGNETKESVMRKWLVDEVRYAKRQLTWFKKDKRVIWFDSKDTKENVERTVKKWYDHGDDSKN